MLETLETLDQNIFHLINSKLISLPLDRIMPFVTDFRNTWWIVMLLALYWVYSYRIRAIKIIIGCALVVGVSDQINSHIIKDWAKRERPPQALGLDHIRLLTHNHSGYSFMSSHAINVFAAATYISLAQPELAILVFPIAALVAYSRVYVGVHFPADVFFGALAGMLIAWLIRKGIEGLAQKSKLIDKALN